MSLKGSKTEQNLKDAFAGESQANRRYLYFASKADIEGYNDVSAVFRSTAVKIARPTARKVDAGEPDYLTGDCALARSHIASLMRVESISIHPMLLLRVAYGI